MITLRRRSGLTLVEVIITIVILGIVGGGLVRMLTSQAEFYEHQGAGRSARSISRAALNVLLSEMRMVEATGGVVAATPTQLTLRVPYAVGIYCASPLGVSTVMLLPTDSAMLAEPGFSGYAYRSSTAQYTYVEAGATLTLPVPGTCIAAGINPPANSVRVGLLPVLPATALTGAAVLLTKRITYAFAPSAAIPGRVALWRQVDATGAREELAAPFDAASRFRFYRFNNNAAQDAVPPLNEIRGFELVLTGASEVSPRSTGIPQRAPLTTSVFFRNRQ